MQLVGCGSVVCGAVACVLEFLGTHMSSVLHERLYDRLVPS